MNTITVGIADDHKIFRKGVILSLRQYTNISFVFEAENGEELLKELETTSKSGSSGLVNLTCIKVVNYLENLLIEINNI